MNPRLKPVWISLSGLILLWLLAFAGYTVAKQRKVTPDTVRAYVRSLEFDKLNVDDRRKALDRLADMLNSLSYEDRQRLRLERTWETWFRAMTEDEKGGFIEATLPTGFKQMIGAFEELPEDRRRRFMGEALRRVKETQDRLASGAGTPEDSTLGGSSDPGLTEELRQKAATIGLRTFYSESSARTKAELAPLLEEMQRLMQSGRMLRDGSRR